MTEENQEGLDPRGRPMVPTTPRDVVYIRLASFALIPIVILAVFGFATGTSWLVIAAVVLAVIAIAFIVVGVRRQSRRPGSTTEEAG
ncbi:hypothetical protein [Streptosporangium pseudovulgare]|uniref:DUF3040 domain-containing protein n=1 Tax=Streptosporangium pseudovulgare TaxID=35765 RepID=A0ABQ2R1R4_9ACTN|nr:hypothetical protein [Streptosporangium pseudovulgare]GGQ09333.1 hypothetical protein GCM10010140_44400 [Streptosporangium pseudovulgare]